MKRFVWLYTDEDVANLVATLLRSRGLDVLTTLEAGMAGCSDDRQLAYAASESRCLLTQNRGDYERLHLHYLARGQQHSGIIVTPQNSAYEIAKRVGILLNTLTAEEVFNQLLYA